MKSLFYKALLLLPGTILAFGLHEAQAQYCVDSLYFYGCSYGDYIDNVSMGGISQTGTGCDTNGYSDYTNLTANFEQGSTYSLTVTSNNYFDYVSMWIDFNDDYSFEDSEKVVSDLFCNYPNTNYSASFGISPLAPLGAHRLRLRLVYVTYGFDACSYYTYGEVHDYTAEIGPPTDMVYVSSTTTQAESDSVSLGATDVEIIGIQVVTSGSLNPLALTAFTLNSNGTTDFYDVTNVKVYYTGTNPAFSTNNLFGSLPNLATPITGTQGLSEGVNYFWMTYDISPTATIGDYLDAECTQVTIDGSGYTPTITAPAGNCQVGYCIPVDVYGCYFAFIDGVELNTLSNTSSYCNGNFSGYINFPPNGNLTTSLEQGNSYSISLYASPFELEGFGVWIDYNNDGDFDDTAEFAYATPTIDSGLQSGIITIPLTAGLGDHRMRVRSQYYDTLWADESCSTFNYGETEDYTITITPFQCSANFTLYPDSLIPHHYWALNLANGIPPLTYLWSWGDSTYDTIAYPSHTYAAAGFYTICMTIHDSTGCESNFCSTYDIQKQTEENTIITVDVVDSLPGVATVIQNTDVLQSWSVFPNPASGTVFVNYSLSTPATVSVEVYDVLGNKLQQKITGREAGQYHSTIDVQKLPDGIYFLQIRAGEQVASEKLVLLR